jgi:hypothetical protein
MQKVGVSSPFNLSLRFYAAKNNYAGHGAGHPV